jgi:hypothetical protein
LRCVYKEAGSLVALGLREAPAESGRATDTAGYVCPYPMTSPCRTTAEAVLATETRPQTKWEVVEHH